MGMVGVRPFSQARQQPRISLRATTPPFRLRHRKKSTFLWNVTTRLIPINVRIRGNIGNLSHRYSTTNQTNLHMTTHNVTPHFRLLPISSLPPRRIRRLPNLQHGNVPPILRHRQFSMTSGLIIFGVQRRFLRTLSRVKPSTIQSTRPRPKYTTLRRNRFQFRLRGTNTLKRSTILRFKRFPFPVNPRRNTNLQIQFQLVTPPFPPRRRLRPKNVTILSN